MPIASILERTMNEIIVIGGGPAGMMAAIAAATAGERVTLLEKNEKLGKKLYITGKGRCNVTNNCTREVFLRNVAHNPRFLYSAFENLSPQRLMDFFTARGCRLVTERGNRVFPESNHASDITRVLEGELHRLGVRLCLRCPVSGLIVQEGAVRGVELQSGETLSGDRVILATGGQSYPSTGSTGDGWRWLAAAGHTVDPPLPSLAGIVSEESWVPPLQGLSLKNVTLTVRKGKKVLFSELGEMLFTHFGFSGPLILSASAYITELDPAEVSLTLNLKPGLTEKQLEDRILRDVAAAPKKQLSTLMAGLLPARLGETVAALCDIDTTQPCGSLQKEQRKRLMSALQALPLPWSGIRPLEEAIVTRGGLNVKEVNPSTMESQKIKGLYIAGEMLDTDALTGGFNLQIAFSTGALAGRCAAGVEEWAEWTEWTE